jgi:hypothetical protein
VRAQAVVLSYREIDLAYLRRNLGVVVAVAVCYGAFLLGLALLRLFRSRESVQYLKYVSLMRRVRSCEGLAWQAADRAGRHHLSLRSLGVTPALEGPAQGLGVPWLVA